MSYRNYLVQINKKDLDRLMECKKNDMKEIMNYFDDNEYLSVQSLCCGKKANVILNLGDIELNIKFDEIPEILAFKDFEPESFLILDKEKFINLIEKYKNEYKIRLLDICSRNQDNEYQDFSNDANVLKKQLAHEYRKEFQSAKNEFDEIDYVFNTKELKTNSDEVLEPLLKTNKIRDDLVNLFYIYRHFKWNDFYLIYGGW